ncbi:S8 family serine peptidase [Longimicrobium terrae]|uniref:Subtilisin family serine protease n=1 Tax=Longimicrobium terrae TaxID=1639882 RepID=A0A841GY99_9BACT|nr:S8 family serine peptidase [Longimicrobium terrae]MBB4636349.1 subtilisin family serine protease [Longimicrobium terrae]MBB6070745.1 subtilisin family serine protease [Longimicrobium terrae]NNC29724.1 S8 family serine peptidase [Longimicrobium terrae]
MRRSLPFAAFAAALAVGACQDAQLATPSDAALSRSDNAPLYVVTFKPGVDVDAATGELAHGNGLAVRSVRHHAARGFSAVIPEARLARIAADPRVEIVEKDYVVTLRLPVEGQGKPSTGGGTTQTTPWGITRVGGAGDGTGKTAWILDTGIDLNHADLNTSRACHTYFAGTSPADGNGHGTHVAGTIAARNNGQDVVGVAANAYVCSVRVLGNSGSGSYAGIIDGINYVAANGASGDVANLSLGGSGTNATLEKAVQDVAAKGIRMVLAAGNDGQNAANFTPARVNGNNIYTISAIASNGCMASFSNFGNPPVDFAAPGVSILSTRKGGGTTTMSGTSMAAPHVAGILLLGAVRGDGTATCDPDGSPDPIAHR